MNEVNIYEVIIYCVWEGCDPKGITTDMIAEPYRPTYNSVLDYISKGNAPGDLFLTKDKINKDVALRLNEISNFCSTATFELYKKDLLKNYYTKQLYQHIAGGMDIKVIAETVDKIIAVLKPENKQLKIYDQNTALSDYIDELDNRITGNIDWYDWGIDFLDKYIGKLRMGKLIILKGKRKFGKTTFATMVLNSFLQRDISVVFISTEMGHFQILDKLLSLNTQINSFDIIQGKIDPKESIIINTIEHKLAYKKNKIVLCTHLDIKNIEELIQQYRPKIIIIDYLQMLSIDNIPAGMNHSQVMGNMAVKLKNICLENDLSVLALSQVNADGDTKNCKSFEETADTILWLNENKKEAETDKTNAMLLSIVNRDGNSGDIKLIYHKLYGNFCEQTNDDELEEKHRADIDG